MSAWRTHPHLYFDAEGLKAIQRKVEHPRFKPDWEAVVFRTDQDMDTPLLSSNMPENSQLRLAAYLAARAAFVYRITGEKRYGQRAHAYLQALLEIPRWSHNPKDCPFGLREGAMALHLGEAYDLIADEMPAAKRGEFVQACMKRLVAVFLENCKSPENQYLNGHRTMNHLALHASGATCLTLALDGDAGDLSREIEIARAHLLRFVEWYDDAGASLEIDGYWGYANEHVIRALAALRANGWPEIFKQRAKKLERYMYPLLCMSIGAKFITNFADSYYGDDVKETREGLLVKKRGRFRQLPEDLDRRHVSYRLRTCALALAAEFQDGRLQWYADRMPWGDQFGIVCGDADLAARPPGDLPTTVAYHGCGIGVIRSSMTDPDALLLGLKAGRARGPFYDDPHSQFDLNSVVLEAFGEPLLADPGYHHEWGNPAMSTIDPHHISNSTPPHNTVLVGGKGQIFEDCPIAHLQDLSPDDETDYLVSRIERAYGPRVLRFERHAYCLAKSFFVLVDEILLRAPEHLIWNFHAAEEAVLQAAVPPNAATVVRGKAQLTLIPFGLSLTCKSAADHLLPRLQFDTTQPLAAARAGWLLLPHRRDAQAPHAEAGFKGAGVEVRSGSKTWSLPVVVRRPGFRSDIMLPFPQRAQD